MKLVRASALGAALLTLGLVGTGCNQSASGMAIMDTDASVIAPPAAVAGQASLKTESIRSLAESEGRQYFVARSAESDTYCVIQYKMADESSASGCGPARGGSISILGFDGMSVALVTDGHDMSAGGKEPWVKLSENLWKRSGM